MYISVKLKDVGSTNRLSAMIESVVIVVSRYNNLNYHLILLHSGKNPGKRGENRQEMMLIFLVNCFLSEPNQI